MKSRILFLAAWLVTASMPLAAGQLYQWKDAQGRTIYSDQQPPTHVRNAQQKTFKDSASGLGASPARPAQERPPVTLYNTACGVICNHARQYLVDRGIVHQSRDPETSPQARAELQKLTARLTVPILVVGSETAEGFFPDKWDALLTKTGHVTHSGRPVTAQPAPPRP